MARLKDALRSAFTEARKAHPDEHFYVFAVFAEDEGEGLQPSCNTLEALARRAKKLGQTPDQLRWFAEEFEYHQVGEAHLADVKLTGRKASVAALQALDREGFFGKGKAREEVALLYLRSDQDNREVAEVARALNPRAVSAQIAAAFPVRKPKGKPQLLGKPDVYAIDSIALSSDGKTLAASGWFGGEELFAWQVGARPKQVLVKRRTHGFKQLALSPDGSTLWGLSRETLTRLSLPGAKALPGLVGISGIPSAIALGADGARIAVVDEQGIGLWNTQTRERLARCAAKPQQLCFSPDGARLVTPSEILDGTSLVQLAGLASKRVFSRIAASSRLIAAASYLPGAPIALFRLTDGEPVDELPGHRSKGVTSLAFSNDGQRLVSAGEDGQVRVFDVGERELLLEVEGRQEAMSCALFLDDGRVAAGGRDTSNGPPVYLWKL
jgi:hypothetical protein